MIAWLSENYVEVLGVVFSLLYLMFSIRRNILLWPMGIISAMLYMVVFYQSKFYADMGLNGYYLFISIYGWALWGKAGRKGNNELEIGRISLKLTGILIPVTALVFFGIGMVLDQFTDSLLGCIYHCIEFYCNLDAGQENP